jgi:hypothetical protein
MRHEDVWGSGDIAPLLFSSALDGGEWSTLRPCRFTPGTHQIVDWVAPALVWTLGRRENVLRPPAIEPRLLCHPAHFFFHWRNSPNLGLGLPP